MKKILVVDDDIHIGNVIEEVLSKEGYQVLRAYSGTEALLMLPTEPDLVLLDLMLPGLPGEEVIDKIHDIPVIIISAKIDIDDKVGMLTKGASDYITKPFDSRELIARVAVQLRKSEAMSQDISVDTWNDRDANNSDAHRRILRFEEIELDLGSQLVRMISDESSSGHNVKLTRTEFSILKILMQNPNQIVTKSLLLDRLSEDTPDCTDSSLKVHISNLRRKLKIASAQLMEHLASESGADAEGKDYIEAVWGIGFKLREQE